MTDNYHTTGSDIALTALPPKKKDVRVLDGIDALCQFSETARPDVTVAIAAVDAIIEAKTDVEIVQTHCDLAAVALSQVYITFRKFGCTHSQATWKVRAAFEEMCLTKLTKTEPRIADLFRHVGQGFMSEAYRREIAEREERAATEAATHRANLLAAE